MGLLKTLLPTVAIAQQGWNGWFTSELTEVLEPTGLKVTGEVPAWQVAGWEPDPHGVHLGLPCCRSSQFV
jgi:hypothetical protein